MKKLKHKLLNIFHIFSEPYMRILPGNLTYSLMMAIIPILSLAVMLCNSFNISSDLLFAKLGNVVPPSILSTLIEYMTGSNSSSIILVIAGIWAASVGADALIIASNIIYNYEDSNYLQRKIKALILTVLLVFIVIINLVFLVFGNSLLKIILDLFGISADLLFIFKYAKWPIALILIYFIVKVLYTSCPDKNIKSKSVTPGAIFTTIAWMISSAVYSFYLTNFANYGRIYGGLANIIILMIWLYISSYILVVGIAINASDYNESTKVVK